MHQGIPQKNSYQQYLEGGGAMGEQIRSFKWLNTSLGGQDKWPQSLLTSISILLNSRFPMFLWWGPQLIQFYNDAYRPSLGNNGKHPGALGQRGEECWPEIWPTIKPLIDKVMAGGESVWSEDQLIPIYRNNRLENVYWTFSYSKVNDDNGKTCGVLVICNETTEKVTTIRSARESVEKQQKLNKELIESYIQLASVNEALAKKNIELFNAEKNLSVKANELAASESRLRYMLADAPVAIAVFSGRELIVESANNMVLEVWGKDSSIIGKPLSHVLPELEEQLFLQILDDVFTSGKPFYGNEVKAVVEKNNGPEEIYFNFVYHPLKGTSGQTVGIMVVANVVTEQVNARKELEFTIEAAELGTWDLNPVTRAFIGNDRFKAWFGIPLTEQITLKRVIAAIAEKDRNKVISAGQKAIEPGSDGSYSVIYTINNKKDNVKRVVKAKGRATFDANGIAYRFSGTLQDVTEEYKVQQRRDEFLGVASHEIRTPLTSLKASIQILQRLSKTDPVSANIPLFINKANKNLDKLTHLMDGLMNDTKIQQGQVALTKTWFNIVELLKDSCEHIRAAGLFDLLIEGEPELMVYADHTRIGQVIINLVNNAVKYAPHSNRIALNVERIDDTAKLSVQDFGAGIQPDKLPNLFNRYYRIESPGQQLPGLGLGLYISAEVINLHGGKIGVESVVGEGSKFWFILPLNA